MMTISSTLYFSFLLWLLLSQCIYSFPTTFQRKLIHFRPNSLLRSSSTPGPTTNDFKYLRTFAERVQRLSSQESEYISSFWNGDLNSFQIYPRTNATRVSIISTCWSINAILSNPEHWDGKSKWETQSPGQISLSKAVNAVKTSSWTYDAFQVYSLSIFMAAFPSIVCSALTSFVLP